MFGATTNYPFNFSNRLGIPMIESGNVTATDTNVVINIPNRAFRFLNGTGLILFRLNTAIPTGSETLPIVFSSNEFTQPLTLVGGNSATGAEVSGTGIYLIYYAKDCNVMQLINFGPTATATNSNN